MALDGITPKQKLALANQLLLLTPIKKGGITIGSLHIQLQEVLVPAFFRPHSIMPQQFHPAVLALLTAHHLVIFQIHSHYLHLAKYRFSNPE